LTENLLRSFTPGRTSLSFQAGHDKNRTTKE
jgi:hypothetical protein